MKQPLRKPARGTSGSAVTASIRLLRPVVAYLRSSGTDVLAYLQGLGIDPPRLFDANARIPQDLALEGWRRAEQLAGNGDFGLALASKLDLGQLARIEYGSDYLLLHLLLTSPTVWAGLSRMSRYFAIGPGRAAVVADPATGHLRLRLFMPATQAMPRSLAEFVFGWIALILRQSSETAVTPAEICFGHARPESTEDHVRSFGAVPRFGAGENELVYAASDLPVRLRHHDATLLSMLDRRADEELARIGDKGALIDQVRGQLISMLGSGDPGMARTARALDMSVRTLTRRLAELGTSHMAVLDAVRADLARRYLLAEGRTPREVAELLGFSEPSAFRRAFRRWYGEWPSEFQRSGQG